MESLYVVYTTDLVKRKLSKAVAFTGKLSLAVDAHHSFEVTLPVSVGVGPMMQKYTRVIDQASGQAG